MLEKFTTEKVNKVVSDYLSKLKDKVTIDRAILYGSYAKGSATELSDIDLLIVSKDLSVDKPKGMNGYYLDTLVGDVEPTLEVIGVHPNALNHPVTKSFFDEIINSGKVVYSNGSGCSS